MKPFSKQFHLLYLAGKWQAGRAEKTINKKKNEKRQEDVLLFIGFTHCRRRG
jgi:hypothetical protein